MKNYLPLSVDIDNKQTIKELRAPERGRYKTMHAEVQMLVSTFNSAELALLKVEAFLDAKIMQLNAFSDKELEFIRGTKKKSRKSNQKTRKKTLRKAASKAQRR